MKYYGQFQNNVLIGVSRIPLYADDFENKEISQQEFELFMSKEKEKELKEQRKSEIIERLNQLSQDFIQAMAGAEFKDLEERQSEFQALHNELRALEGKEPRVYI